MRHELLYATCNISIGYSLSFFFFFVYLGHVWKWGRILKRKHVQNYLISPHVCEARNTLIIHDMFKEFSVQMYTFS